MTQGNAGRRGTATRSRNDEASPNAPYALLLGARSQELPRSQEYMPVVRTRPRIAVRPEPDRATLTTPPARLPPTSTVYNSPKGCNWLSRSSARRVGYPFVTNHDCCEARRPEKTHRVALLVCSLSPAAPAVAGVNNAETLGVALWQAGHYASDISDTTAHLRDAA